MVVAGLGQRGEVLESGDERGGFRSGEARCIIDGDEVREHDLVVLLERVPGDIEEVVVLVGARVARDA